MEILKYFLWQDSISPTLKLFINNILGENEEKKGQVTINKDNYLEKLMELEIFFDRYIKDYIYIKNVGNDEVIIKGVFTFELIDKVDYQIKDLFSKSIENFFQAMFIGKNFSLSVTKKDYKDLHYPEFMTKVYFGLFMKDINILTNAVTRWFDMKFLREKITSVLYFQDFYSINTFKSIWCFSENYFVVNELKKQNFKTKLFCLLLLSINFIDEKKLNASFSFFTPEEKKYIKDIAYWKHKNKNNLEILLDKDNDTNLYYVIADYYLTTYHNKNLYSLLHWDNLLKFINKWFLDEHKYSLIARLKIYWEIENIDFFKMFNVNTIEIYKANFKMFMIQKKEKKEEMDRLYNEIVNKKREKVNFSIEINDSIITNIINKKFNLDISKEEWKLIEFMWNQINTLQDIDLKNKIISYYKEIKLFQKAYKNKIEIDEIIDFNDFLNQNKITNTVSCFWENWMHFNTLWFHYYNDSVRCFIFKQKKTWEYTGKANLYINKEGKFGFKNIYLNWNLKQYNNIFKTILENQPHYTKNIKFLFDENYQKYKYYIDWIS